MANLRARIGELQDHTGEIFNLEATPGEGTAYRLAMLDKRKHPQIVCANENQYQQGASPYYTNSSQLPVNFTDDLFETLRLQDDLQSQYTGGTVLHIFLGEQIQDISALKRLVRKVASNYRLPYFTLTPTFSVCPHHGYLAGQHTCCDRCTSRTEVCSGVVKYQRPIPQSAAATVDVDPPRTFNLG
jgi:ribonucleoside-triphosphate reductase